ncbi:hypothetical protein N2152v2_010859 [Parachlorella kessleri]
MRLRAALVWQAAADGRPKEQVMSAFMDQVVGVYGFLGFFAAALVHYDPSDLFSAAIGLRLPYSLLLMAHPIMARHIARLHKAMEYTLMPALPQAPWLRPSTEHGQCKAMVGFLGPLFGLVVPAAFLTAFSQGGTSPADSCWWSGRLDAQLLQLLSALLCERGLAACAKAWWILLMLLWAAAVLLY